MSLGRLRSAVDHVLSRQTYSLKNVCIYERCHPTRVLCKPATPCVFPEEKNECRIYRFRCMLCHHLYFFHPSSPLLRLFDAQKCDHPSDLCLSSNIFFLPVSVKVTASRVFFRFPCNNMLSPEMKMLCAVFVFYHQVLDRCLELEAEVDQIPQLKRQVDRYRRSHTDMEVANREQVRRAPLSSLVLSCLFFFSA